MPTDLCTPRPLRHIDMAYIQVRDLAWQSEVTGVNRPVCPIVIFLAILLKNLTKGQTYWPVGALFLGTRYHYNRAYRRPTSNPTTTQSGLKISDRYTKTRTDHLNSCFNLKKKLKPLLFFKRIKTRR